MLLPAKIKLPLGPVYILKRLSSAGYEAALVGGIVRDILRGEIGTDFDFTTNATPEQILELFPESYYTNDFGTVSITDEHLYELVGRPVPKKTLQPGRTDRVIDIARATKLHPSLTNAIGEVDSEVIQSPPYEITTYRSDGAYEDKRRPESVTWGTTLSQDLERRDFTINALAIVVNFEAVNLDQAEDEVELRDDQFKIVDEHDGMNDLVKDRIHTVGDPKTRFSEDALRLLRAIRFSVQLNMQLSDDVYTAIKEQAKNLEHISAERIREELFKILLSPYPKAGIELLDATGLLQYVLPEILPMRGVDQGGHHTTDVWTHSLDALDESPSTDPLVRLATLLHDVGKPATYDNSSGKPTFYNHEVVGSRIAKTIAKRLKLSNKETDRLFILVRFHMFHYQPTMSDAAVRRFMRKVGLSNIDDILDLREGDRLGSGAVKTSWRLEEFKERMIAELHQPFEVTDLEIDGNDLITTLGLKPGRIIGEILQQLFEQVLENPEKNTKAILIDEAKKIISSSASQSHPTN
ncbi:MAG: HD domain-containing protein [Candidatus Pacebacteria bacterium]|nr:HD domain-containing protein [Candidatus Paceibacterota bacterium]